MLWLFYQLFMVKIAYGALGLGTKRLMGRGPAFSPPPLVPVAAGREAVVGVAAVRPDGGAGREPAAGPRANEGAAGGGGGGATPAARAASMVSACAFV